VLVCSGGAAHSGAAHALQKSFFSEASLQPSEVIIDAGVRLLEFSGGDELDSWLSGIKGQACRELRTRADGACGIHATFGSCDPERRELRYERPKELIQSLFAQSLGDIRCSVRPKHTGLVDSVASALWSDFVVPYVEDARLRRPNEEDMFLARLQLSSVWEDVFRHVKRNQDCNKNLTQ
jgi:hypothetical protein